MESQSSHSLGSRAEPWIALALCAAVLVAGALEQLVRNRPAYAETFAPDWLPLAAAGLAAAGIMRLNGRPQWLRVQRALRWSGLLLMVWAANGLPFDLLRLDTPHPAWRRLAGAGDSDVGSRRRRRARASRPGAPGRPCIHPRSYLVRLRRVRARAALPGSQDVRGRWEGRSGSGGPARPAMASPHGCLLSRGCWRPLCPCSWSQRGAGCRAGCCWPQAGPPPPSSP